jgi:hypothetical protein
VSRHKGKHLPVSAWKDIRADLNAAPRSAGWAGLTPEQKLAAVRCLAELGMSAKQIRDCVGAPNLDIVVQLMAEAGHEQAAGPDTKRRRWRSHGHARRSPEREAKLNVEGKS